ncbi:hypothetical protein PTTG_30277, partial [Puccinia triticina 1-1 BBBD Race 1]
HQHHQKQQPVLRPSSCIQPSPRLRPTAGIQPSPSIRYTIDLLPLTIPPPTTTPTPLKCPSPKTLVSTQATCKIQDVKISNALLLAMNGALERTNFKQHTKIRTLKAWLPAGPLCLAKQPIKPS